MNKYRFDDQYENVYEYSAEHDCYVFLTSYFSANIEKADSEETKIEKIQDFEEYSECNY